jgi:hypothetical protein
MSKSYPILILKKMILQFLIISLLIFPENEKDDNIIMSYEQLYPGCKKIDLGKKDIDQKQL